jgi:WD40 repeat protein
LQLVDRAGHAQPLPAPARAYLSVQVSPDGRRAALNISAPYDGVWIYDLDRGGLNRLTFATSGNYGSPVWSPDGKWIAMSVAGPSKNGILKKLAAGGGSEEVLYSTATEISYPTSWSPDGRTLSLGTVDKQTGDDISMLPLALPGSPGQGAPQPLQQRFVLLVNS